MAALIAVAVWFPPDGETVQGPARVIDGDSLVIGDRDLRLKGIDAPELQQTCERDGRAWPCGRAARDALRGMVAGRLLSCRIDGRDRYGRGLASCRVGDDDLNARLVREGHALASGAFTAEQAQASAARRGVWSGSFEVPSAYRQRMDNRT